jgi:hypothetical protein
MAKTKDVTSNDLIGIRVPLGKILHPRESKVKNAGHLLLNCSSVMFQAVLTFAGIGAAASESEVPTGATLIQDFRSAVSEAPRTVSASSNGIGRVTPPNRRYWKQRCDPHRCLTGPSH